MDPNKFVFSLDKEFNVSTKSAQVSGETCSMLF